MTNEESKQLSEYFSPLDIEWRVQASGLNKDGTVAWARVLAYVDARAIQERLDEVAGVGGWKTGYIFHPGEAGGFICELSVKIDGEWVSKQDGAPATDIEPFKGGLSKAFVRVAASGYGIGRYLYKLEANYAEISMDKKDGWKRGEHVDRHTKKRVTFYWKEPALPAWALPKQREENSNKVALELERKAAIKELEKTWEELIAGGFKPNDAQVKFYQDRVVKHTVMLTDTIARLKAKLPGIKKQGANNDNQ